MARNKKDSAADFLRRLMQMDQQQLYELFSLHADTELMKFLSAFGYAAAKQYRQLSPEQLASFMLITGYMVRVNESLPSANGRPPPSA